MGLASLSVANSQGGIKEFQGIFQALSLEEHWGNS